MIVPYLATAGRPDAAHYEKMGFGLEGRLLYAKNKGR
jgi:hypothetical protein